MPQITPQEIGIAIAAAKGLQYTVNIIISAWAEHPKWLDTVKTILDDLLPNPSLPTLRAQNTVIGAPVSK